MSLPLESMHTFSSCDSAYPSVTQCLLHFSALCVFFCEAVRAFLRVLLLCMCSDCWGDSCRGEHTLFCSHQSQTHSLSEPTGGEEIFCQNGRVHLRSHQRLEPQSAAKAPRGLSF